ncbi:MAG TPA: dihydrolipoamide acetyltransferase family protein, partial [Acidobacteriota bacterium]|nr:dihydrolipoamide acetyltransferase family protein [Acidobacteriota bacterium]
MKIIVPQIGQSIAEATIVKWFRRPGERIEKGEVLVEIGTDKVNTEIPAPEAGIVEKLLVEEGETVPVSTEIAILITETPEGGTPRPPAAQGSEETISPVSAAKTEALQSSTYVRKLAREHDIDLSRIRGSGEGGRVTKEDILKIVESRRQAQEEDSERVPMSRMRKLIAEHMVHSKRTTAELSTFFEVDMSEIDRRRKEGPDKFTYLPFIIYAAAKGLSAFPQLNCSIEGEEVVYHKRIHIGVAVALDEGLMAPVIRNADQLSIRELALAAQDLSERARNKRLNPDELQGGTFTITNPGIFGALWGTPIIHQPQVAILALGAVVRRPVAIEENIVIRPVAYLSLTYDHRALDGATADGI